MKRRRWPTSSRCKTSSLSEILKFMFVAARSANRPGSETFILRIAGTSSGIRSTSSASVSADDTTRVTRSSSSDGSGGVSRAARMFAIGNGSICDRSSMTMRRSPWSVIWTVSPGRLMRSCTRAATPTRPRKRCESIGSS